MVLNRVKHHNWSYYTNVKWCINQREFGSFKVNLSYIIILVVWAIFIFWTWSLPAPPKFKSFISPARLLVYVLLRIWVKTTMIIHRYSMNHGHYIFTFSIVWRCPLTNRDLTNRDLTKRDLTPKLQTEFPKDLTLKAGKTGNSWKITKLQGMMAGSQWLLSPWAQNPGKLDPPAWN